MDIAEQKIAFGKRLANLKDEYHYTSFMIYRDCKCTYQTYNSYVSGKAYPRLSVMVSLAEFFNVSLDYLLCRTNMRDIDGDIQEANYDKIGVNIKVLMYSNDITGIEIREITGFNIYGVFRSLKEGSLPSVSSLVTICDFFDISVDYLVGRTNVMSVNGG